MAMNIYGRPMFQGGSIRMAPSIKPLPRYQNGGIVKHPALQLEKYQRVNDKGALNINSETGEFVNPEAAYALLEKMAASGMDISYFIPPTELKQGTPVISPSEGPIKRRPTFEEQLPSYLNAAFTNEIPERQNGVPVISPSEGPIRRRPTFEEQLPSYLNAAFTNEIPEGTNTRDFAVPMEKPIPPVRRQAGGGIEAVMPTDLGALVEPPPMPMPAPPPPGIDEALPQVEQAAQNVGEQEGAQYAMEVMSGLNAAEESGDPEQAINALRGNEMPISGRYEELATYVGDDDAERTPESVLLMVQPTIMLTEQGAMDSGIGSLMENVVGDIDMETAQGAPTAMGEGVGSLMMAQGPTDMEVGQEPPVNFNYGGPVQRFSNGREVNRYTVPPYLVGKQPNVNITRSQVPDDNTLRYKYLREQYPHIADIIIQQEAVSETIPNPIDAVNFGLNGVLTRSYPKNNSVASPNQNVSNNNKDGTKRPPNLSEAITGADATNFGLEPKKEAPTLKELAEARANLYKDILGTEGQEKLDKEELEESKKLAQAQVFFDIAQGGLALAAGDPTLSFAENVARAAAPVVGKISERSAEFTKEKRVLDKARRAQEQAIKLKSVDAVIKAQTDAAAAMTEFERDKFLKLMEMGAKKQSNLMVNIDSDLARIEGFDWKNTALKRGDKGAYKNLEDAKKTFNYLLGRKNDEIPGGGFTVSLTKFLRKAGNIFGIDQSNMQETLQELSTLEKSMAFDFNVFTSIIPGISTRDASGIAVDEKEYASMIPAYADSGVFDAGSLKSELNKAQLLYDGIKAQVIDTAATINDLAIEGKNTSDVYSRLKARYTYGKQLMGKLQGYIKVMDPDPQPSMVLSNNVDSQKGKVADFANWLAER